MPNSFLRREPSFSEDEWSNESHSLDTLSSLLTSTDAQSRSFDHSLSAQSTPTSGASARSSSRISAISERTLRSSGLPHRFVQYDSTTSYSNSVQSTPTNSASSAYLTPSPSPGRSLGGSRQAPRNAVDVQTSRTESARGSLQSYTFSSSGRSPLVIPSENSTRGNGARLMTPPPSRHASAAPGRASTRERSPISGSFDEDEGESMTGIEYHSTMSTPQAGTYVGHDQIDAVAQAGGYVLLPAHILATIGNWIRPYVRIPTLSATASVSNNPISPSPRSQQTVSVPNSSHASESEHEDNRSQESSNNRPARRSARSVNSAASSQPVLTPRSRASVSAGHVTTIFNNKFSRLVQKLSPSQVADLTRLVQRELGETVCYNERNDIGYIMAYHGMDEIGVVWALVVGNSPDDEFQGAKASMYLTVFLKK
ncbi:hypothetical protein CPC08DRAFT_117857 [Agrocybe pediades]|nr:hypothetical protein CPC08DRAFT_117857 [Agrocybe pediades]